MKKMMKGACLLLATALVFAACKSNDDQPTDATWVDGASDSDGSVTSDMTSAELKEGSDGLTYVYDGDSNQYEIKDAAGSWVNVTSTYASVESAGDDKVLKFTYDLTGSARQVDLSYFVNGKDLSASVWTTKIYIPESYTASGATAYPQLRFFEKYGSSWTTDYVASFNTTSYGSGWKTVAIDFANKTITVDGTALTAGTGESTSFTDSFTSVKSVGIEFYADGCTSMDGAFYIDYLNITGMTSEKPAAPVISCLSNTVTITCSTTDPAPTIYYSTDGTTPSATASKYSAPFAITATTTVKAIAINTNGNSSVTTKECTFAAAGTQGSAKLTFTESASGEKKPYFSYTPSDTTKVLSSISFDIYVPQATYDAGFTGGKAYWKTGDSWTWGNGDWVSLTAATWTTITATPPATDGVQIAGFAGYAGASSTGGTDLVMYFDNFKVTYTDGTSETFDFNSGVPSSFGFTSDTSGTGSVGQDTTQYN
jgi:hypothetical protein